MEREIMRFEHYNPTKEEIVRIFGSHNDYKIWLEAHSECPQSSDIIRIIELLVLRDEKNEAFSLIEAVDDDKDREHYRQVLNSMLYMASFPEGVPRPFSDGVF